MLDIHGPMNGIKEKLAAEIKKLSDNKYAHRDILPKNILVKTDPNGVVELTLTDFGSSCEFNSCFKPPENVDKYIEYLKKELNLEELNITPSDIMNDPSKIDQVYLNTL